MGALDKTLGRLERVPLRDIWANEATEFTPWLAREDNIKLLGEAIGLDLEVEAQEKDVGPFRADILCKDTATDAWVLVENQLERTDHGHLGQLITYAAGLQTVTIVWVAERFTDEHRAALDWLNQVTAEHINFFGLEVELWRIGTSPAAPKFNVVCQPNEWTRTVASAASRAATGELSEKRQTYLEFWQRLADRIRETKSILRHGTPRPRNFFPVASGRSGFNFSAGCGDGSMWVGLNVHDPALWRALERLKDEVKREFGSPLEWDFKPGRRQNYLFAYVDGINLADRATWPEQLARVQAALEKLHKTFAPRIRDLQPEPAPEPSLP